MDATRTKVVAIAFLWISACAGFSLPVVAPFQWSCGSRMLSSRDDDNALLQWVGAAADRKLQLSIGTSMYSGGGQGFRNIRFF